MKPDLIIGFPESEALARGVATLLEAPFALAALHRFPDGESLVRLEGAPRRAVIVRSLDRPNDKLVELALLAGALRERGTESLTLAAPYLAYMRQDMEFRPGEAVSQRIVGRWLADLFDRIVTVDPHLHRTHDLGEVFPGRAATALSAAPLLGAWARQQGAGEGWVVVGPDEESAPLVKAVAEAAGSRSLVGRKVRRGDRDVSVDLPGADALSGTTVFLVDDVVSSGGTLIEVAEKAKQAGAVRLVAGTVHALYPDAMAARFLAAGIGTVVSTDAVPHASNAIGIAGLLAAELRC